MVGMREEGGEVRRIRGVVERGRVGKVARSADIQLLLDHRVVNSCANALNMNR